MFWIKSSLTGTVTKLDGLTAWFSSFLTMDRRVLSEDDRAGEVLFTGLRLTEGIDRAAFATRFGHDPWVTYRQDLAPFEEAGMIWERAGRMGLSRQGMLMANEILVTFV